MSDVTRATVPPSRKSSPLPVVFGGNQATALIWIKRSEAVRRERQVDWR
jgi:hypothetical protein